MLPTVNQAQSQLTKLGVEESTGQYADLGLQLGDQAGYELSLRNQVGLLETLTSANGVTGANMSASQAALSSMLSSAQTAAQDVTTWTTGTDSGARLQTIGQSALQQFIAVANTSAGGQYVFGGVNGSQQPVSDYYAARTSAAKASIDQAFQTTFGFPPTDPAASSITSTQMQGFLTGPFASLFSGSNWTSDWSQASSTNTSAQVAPGNTITTSTNANTPGFQQLAQGYAMLAEFGGTPLSAGAMQEVATQALGTINAGVNAITATQASLGAAQGQLTEANATMSSQMTIMQTRLGSLDSVNASEVATQLNSLTTQIETAYQLTAQLQKLSLAQYL